MAGREPPARAASCARPSAGNRSQVRRLETQASDPDEVEGLYTRGDALRPRQRVGDRRAHVRARLTAPAPSRRRIRPASGRCFRDGSALRPAPACTPNSRQASMNSSPLFMSVAESTEILRPMTQFGCAQASSGVTCVERARGRVEERPAGSGEQDALHARAARRRHARRAAGTGTPRCARCRWAAAWRPRRAPCASAAAPP